MTYMCLFNCQRKDKKKKKKNSQYAIVHRNAINDGNSQTSPLPIFLGRGDVCTQAVSHFVTSLKTEQVLNNIFTKNTLIHNEMRLDRNP